MWIMYMMHIWNKYMYIWYAQAYTCIIRCIQLYAYTLYINIYVDIYKLHVYKYDMQIYINQHVHIYNIERYIYVICIAL